MKNRFTVLLIGQEISKATKICPKIWGWGQGLIALKMREAKTMMIINFKKLMLKNKYPLGSAIKVWSIKVLPNNLTSFKLQINRE